MIARAKQSSLAATLAALLCTLLAPGGYAQPEAGPPLGTGWHIARPGDTLRGLSRRYSGGEERWRENWRLNPGIQDPNRIEIGERIQLLLVSNVPEDLARITRLSHSVETKPTPVDWEAAFVDALLRGEDALRTYERSSAEMLFGDGSELKITESSLVFLRKVGRGLEAVPRDEIEIVDGQADLSNRATRTGARGIDVLLGTARLTPRPSPAGEVATRARKRATAAQLMVYEGAGAVASGGAQVDLPRGTGTVVEEGRPPAPPEALLPAPELTGPAAEASFAFGNPGFTWQAVPGAASYTVEVCRDPGCGALELRASGLATPLFRPGSLPTGSLFWRVTAGAASGLDGYPSASRALTVTSGRADVEPPAVWLTFAAPTVGCGSRHLMGRGARLDLGAEDPSGIAGWTYTVNGQAVDRAAFAGPWAAGAQTLEATATDRAGNIATVGPLSLVSDPDPPVIAVESGNAGLIREHGRPDRARQALPGRLRRHARDGAVLEWSADGARWLPLAAGSAALALGDEPQIFLRSPGSDRGGDAFSSDSPVRLPADRLLHVTVEDAACGVERVRFGIGPGSGAGRRAFWIEATDLVGNVAREEWALAAAADGR